MYATALDPKLSLRQNFQHRLLTAGRPAPGRPPSPRPRKAVTFLDEWKTQIVTITFQSGRTLTGKLTNIWRYDLGLEVEGRPVHVPKHAVEYVVAEA